MPGQDVDIGQVREPLSSFAVLVIYLFMLVFTMFRAFTDNNDKDEDFISCTCRDSDHSFYTAIIVLFSVIWGIVVIVWYAIRVISWLNDNEDKDIYKTVVALILEPFSFLAHLALLPLLFLQFLSTYAWICLVGDKYCQEDVSSNQLQIDRSGILLGFFIAAAVIGFTSKMTMATK